MTKILLEHVIWFLVEHVIWFLAGWGTADLLTRIWNWFRDKSDWQPSKAWCTCGHEVLQDPESKIYEVGTHTNIICSKCGTQTSWDLDAPAPLLLDVKK